MSGFLFTTLCLVYASVLIRKSQHVDSTGHGLEQKKESRPSSSISTEICQSKGNNSSDNLTMCLFACILRFTSHLHFIFFLYLIKLLYQKLTVLVLWSFCLIFFFSFLFFPLSIKKTTDRAKVEAAALSNIITAHHIDQETVQQWVCDVRQWAVKGKT